MDSTFSSCGYCWEQEEKWEAILHYKCDGCGKRIHYGCIKNPQPSSLLGDTFFNFKCRSCGDEDEEFNRIIMSWRQIVMLALYNLHKTGQGRCGYFHWKAHICTFIDLHWLLLFGQHRKKTGLWFGTVAGALSSGCPVIFESGTAAVEQGYWKLVSVVPPLPSFDKKSQKSQRKRQSVDAVNEYVDMNLPERASRKPKTNPMVAAIELKEKRASMTVSHQKKKKRNEKNVVSQEMSPRQTKGKSASQKKSIAVQIDAKSNSANSDVNQCDIESLNKSSDASSCISEDSLSISSLDVTLQMATPNSTKIQSESADSFFSFLPSTSEDISSGSVINIVKTEDLDIGSDDDFDIDIESMVMGPLSEINDVRPVSPDINMLLDIGQSNTPSIMGKSPIKVGTNHIYSDIFNAEHSEGEDERNLQEDDEAEEDCNESDSDENEEEDEEDIHKASSQDENENTDSQSGKEFDEFKEKADNLESSKTKLKKIGRPRKRRRVSDLPPASPPQSLKRVSLFEEGELLNKLNAMAEKQNLIPELAQLRRKLLCNQTNREFGLPVFDLDAHIEKATKQHSLDQMLQKGGIPKTDMFLPRVPNHAASLSKETRDLDRFMMKNLGTKAQTRTYSRFYQRLVGLEDKDIKPFVSPYTTRILMPFIWRNYDMKYQPLKLRLLQEIKSYPHRNDPTWKPEPTPPIDYCYVRPEHIPSVNALCREFFWPGIDMSECLHYPDFSCVVLYRKIVIGFAFMVPDRGYNEAYISFIFTHPEWRKVGIASFMLYHLIQTCMGKDLLLHVSASSQAMLLYQKFGFKAQELILNFYYKYFPLNSSDSPHAFLMRLHR